MMTTSTVLEVILDASVLINFLTIDRVDLLQHLPGHRFVIAAHVAGEITYHDDAQRLATAIQAHTLQLLPAGSHCELATFARLTTMLGIGESAAIAAAQHRSMLIAVEDRTARRTAESLVGKNNVLSSFDLVLRAVQAGLVTITDADAIKADWEANDRLALP